MAKTVGAQMKVDPIVLNSRLYRSHIAVLDSNDLVRLARELELARRHNGTVINWNATDVSGGIVWATAPARQRAMWERVYRAVNSKRREKGIEDLCRHDLAELDAMPLVTEPQMI